MMKQPITASTSTWSISPPILFALLLIWALQTAARPETSNLANARASGQPPLRYRTIATEPGICQGEDLELELELENTSTHSVEADPKALTYQVSVTGDGHGSSSVADPLQKPSSSQLMTLPPGKSYRTTIRYPLKADRFPPGIYRIRLTYGQFADPSSTLPNLFRGAVDSNVVLFQILDCDNHE